MCKIWQNKVPCGTTTRVPCGMYGAYVAISQGDTWHNIWQLETKLEHSRVDTWKININMAYSGRDVTNDWA